MLIYNKRPGGVLTLQFITEKFLSGEDILASSKWDSLHVVEEP